MPQDYSQYGIFADTMRSPTQGLVQNQWDDMSITDQMNYATSNPNQYNDMLTGGNISQNTSLAATSPGSGLAGSTTKGYTGTRRQDRDRISATVTHHPWRCHQVAASI